MRVDNTSGIKGVVWCKSNQRWVARITRNRRTVNLGYYRKKEDAAKLFPDLCSALDKAAKRNVIHGNHAARQKSRFAVRLGKMAAPAAK